MENPTYENQVFCTSLDKAGVVHTKVKKRAKVDINHAVENTEFVRLLCDDGQAPMLVDLREIHSITQEARSHFSMQDRKGHAICLALLINSPVSRIVGNFFIGISKPTVPTRLFSDEDDAKAWLLKQKERYA